MKQAALLVTAIIMCLTIYAQQNGKNPVYAIEQLNGNWQETGRTDTRTNKPVSLNPANALYIHISKDSSVYMEGTANLPAYGNAYITHGTQLYLPNNDFKIVSASGQTLVLDDYEHMIHTFTKTTDPLPGEIKPAFCANCVVNISPASLSKNWFAYSISGHPENAISLLIINSMNADKSFSGNISSVNLKYKNEPCTLIFSGRELQIKAKSFSWNEWVYKASGDSLTIGKVKDHMYYFRKQEQEKPIETIRH
jgi:hypothetical protein